MSRRRSRHQTSRRRIYRTRQHELRERCPNVAREADDWVSDQVGTPDVEECLEMESPTALGLWGRGPASHP